LRSKRVQADPNAGVAFHGGINLDPKELLATRDDSAAPVRHSSLQGSWGFSLGHPGGRGEADVSVAGRKLEHDEKAGRRSG
jgi:hypothetical protein